MNQYAHDPLASLPLDINPVNMELPTNLNICNPLAGDKSSKLSVSEIPSTEGTTAQVTIKTRENKEVIGR